MGNWKTDYIAAKFSPEQVSVMKEEYAKLLAKHNRDSEKAFLDPQMDIITKFDLPAKLYIKNNWIFNVEILERVEHFLSKGVSEILPTKEQIAQRILNIANRAYDNDDELKALKEYTSLMGFNKEQQETTNAVQNVILVTDNGDNLTWEEKMKMQQHNLKETAERMLSEQD